MAIPSRRSFGNLSHPTLLSIFVVCLHIPLVMVRGQSACIGLSCYECTYSASGCGWCSGLSKCVSSTSSICSHALVSTCPCNDLLRCNHCLGNVDCGWCSASDDSGTCVDCTATDGCSDESCTGTFYSVVCPADVGNISKKILYAVVGVIGCIFLTICSVPIFIILAYILFWCGLFGCCGLVVSNGGSRRRVIHQYSYRRVSAKGAAPPVPYDNNQRTIDPTAPPPVFGEPPSAYHQDNHHYHQPRDAGMPPPPFAHDEYSAGGAGGVPPPKPHDGDGEEFSQPPAPVYNGSFSEPPAPAYTEGNAMYPAHSPSTGADASYGTV